MDLITIDVSKIPQYDLYVGAEVEILGKNISIEKMAEWAATTRHNILTSLSPKLHKTYL